MAKRIVASGLVLLFCVSWLNAEAVCVVPREKLPLELYQISVGAERLVTFDLPACDGKAVYLFLGARDVDRAREMKVLLNGQVLPIPDTILNEVDDAFAYLPVPGQMLNVGENELKFVFADNLNNTTGGYFVNQVEFWLCDVAEEAGLVEKLDKKCVIVKPLINADKEKSYRYKDNFNDETVGTKPDYWVLKSGVCSVSVDKDGSRALLLGNAKKKSHAVLHVFSSTTTIETTFRPLEVTDKSSFWLAVRYNLDDAYVIKAGYDCGKKRWAICEYRNRAFKTYRTAEDNLEVGRVYRLRLEADKSNIKLYVDDELKCETFYVRTTNYGRVGLYADYGRAEYDDFGYCGTGKVQDGVTWWYEKGFGNGGMVTLKDGSLLLQYSGPDRHLVSYDDGVSWQPKKDFKATVNWCAGNLIRLASGKLLNVYQKRFSDHPHFKLQAFAEISADEGKTWDGPFPVQPGPGGYCTMNAKITQVSSGRIFFPTSTGGEGVEGEEIGGIGVFYSDDEGRTWQESQNRLDLNTTGVNLQEGEVEELSDGRLALIARTNLNYLGYLVSDDNGQSWDTAVHKVVPAVMCAFNTMRDEKTGRIFLFWPYEDSSEQPDMHQYPRERISLAVSDDDMKSWTFLTDIDDFMNHRGRFMNLGIYVDDGCVYTMVSTFGTGQPGRAIMQITRLELDKLSPYEEFPPLH